MISIYTKKTRSSFLACVFLLRDINTYCVSLVSANHHKSSLAIDFNLVLLWITISAVGVARNWVKSGEKTREGLWRERFGEMAEMPPEDYMVNYKCGPCVLSSVDMKNIVPKESLTCLVAKATLDESMLWHRRLGHVNFKTINKLVKDNLVRGLPTKRFENDQTCVACLKGKQHKASCKSKIQNSITQPLFMLHMDLFGPTFMSSLMNKKYCLVVTDDYSRFTWVFFLASKDETSGILKSFITQIENLVDKKVKIIRCDNGTEFKNRVMSEFCEKKGIKREFSIARTPQQNGVAKRRNRTLIEAARTMVLVVKPHNKTPYELFRGRTPSLSFMKPFECYVTIVNTLDHLGKFDGKSDDGFFFGYSLNSKAFKVYNIKTRKVEENLHIRFLEDKPIIAGDGPKWLFDINVLTKSMNYVSIIAGTNSNDSVDGSLFLMPLWKDDEGRIDDQERTKNST
ncbi:putative ribonuclease H-like domain-containing protein [Tanacetum coccineum]